jgi:hypothetical protein
MRLIALLLAGVVFALLAAPSGAIGASAGGRIISANGVRLVVPAGWQRVPAAPAGPVTDPITVLVVGTAGVRPRPSQCQIAAYRIPPAGAVVVIVRWKSIASAGGGPLPQGRAPLLKLRSVHRPSFECFSGRGAVAEVLLGGHPYQVNVMVGDRAGKERVAAALAVARSFALTR